MGIVVDELSEFTRSREAERFVQEIREHQLPSECVRTIEEYERLDHSRDRYIWKWVHSTTPNIDLPFVDDRQKSNVRTLKLFATIFITVLDDILEFKKDESTFREASKVPFPYLTSSSERDEVDSSYINYAEQLWSRLMERLESAQRFDEYVNSFRYDLKQSINAIEYSALVSEQPDFPSLDELLRYESHNMMMFPFSNIDLMHSCSFDDTELAKLRETVWQAQELVRIANWISTWERELKQGDFSSGVVVYSLRDGIVTSDEISALRSDKDTDSYEEIVEKIRQASVEETLIDRWDKKYLQLQSIASKLNSIDLSSYVEGTREVMKYDLASQGMM